MWSKIGVGAMKVKDLIEELKLYNPEQEIYGVLAEDESSEQYLLETLKVLLLSGKMEYQEFVSFVTIIK